LAATQENHGVNEAFGNGARIATGELLLMTDSGGLFEPQALKTAIRHFADPKVGLVNGLFDHTNPEGKPVASGYRSYWAIETLVKLMEARLGLACVIVGAFEVIRRSLYWPIPSGLSNDMSVPMRLHAQGYKVIYEPRAIVRAPQKKRPKQEFQRRLRMAVRGWCTILPLIKLVPPWKTPINWLALLSHKYLRWLSGFFMAGMFAANVLLLGRPVFLGLFVAQAAFYAMALVGWLLSKVQIQVKIFSLPFFFCVLQMAAMAGFFQSLAGHEIRTWKPTD
jgi:cellulose synthase/poly-beta-1,6-N-acetylglucosamine synthase-like glycosyltransferase